MTANKKQYSLFEMGTFAALAGKDENGAKGRIMLGAALGLTSCEISVNSMPAGGFSPFVHSHKLNEEVYIIVSGNGVFHVDGEEFPVKEGSIVRVAPGGKRAVKAGDQALTYICVQAQDNSLTQAVMEDGILNEEKTSWM